MVKEYDISHMRNMGLVGHGGDGKTSLAEAILFNAGAVNRLGKVLEGSTVMDYDPDEIRRNISITSSNGFCEWNKHRLILIDTPGEASFLAEAQTCLRVVDGMIFVVSLDGGVKVQTEKMWLSADDYGLSRIVFVNKMDQERGDFSQVIAELEKAFKGRGGTVTNLRTGKEEEIPNQNPVVITLPIGSGEGFRGVVDLVTMKALVFDDDGSGKFLEEEMPPDLQDEAGEYREKLVESAAETSDELLEKYLEGAELSDQEIRECLRKGTFTGQIVPVLAGSAIKNMGVQPLMDYAISLLPAPQERPPVRGKDPRSNEPVERRMSKDEPFSALVYKTVADPYAGRLSMFRIISGSLSSDSTVFNANSGSKERIGQIFFIQGKSQLPTPSVTAGDVAAVAKLKATNTGDSLCDEKNPIIFQPLSFPEPVFSVAIVPKSKGDEEKVSAALQRLKEEDPTIQIGRDTQTKELILSGVGEMHLDVMVERMKRKFGVEVEMKPPRVPYKETIKGTTRVQGRYKKQTGGRGQYGDTWIEIEPLPRGGGREFVDKIVGGAIPRQYIPAVDKGIQEAMAEGVLAGYPIVDVRVTLYDGSFHTVDSSEMAFKIAGSLGFKKGIVQCNPVLLEPIMNMEVVVPDDCMGDVIGDLNSKRGRIMGMDAAGSNKRIRAQVPMAEVLAYSSTLRSMTGGRGSFTMSFSHYEEVPSHIQERIVAASKKEGEESK